MPWPNGPPRSKAPAAPPAPNAEPATPPPDVADAVEDALTSDRLARLERIEEAELGFHRDLLEELRAHGGKLDTIADLLGKREEREAREEEARIKASAAEEEVRLKERSAWGAFWRDNGGKLVVGVGALMGAAAVALQAWAAGWLSTPPPHP